MKIGNQLKLFFSNPFVVASFITLGVIYFLPKFLEKFELNLVEQALISPDRKIQFVDVEDDGKSEKFEFFTNSVGNFGYTLHDGNNIIVDQFNFSTKSTNYNNIWFQDANENGIKELYALTINNDSIFLNIHEHFAKVKIWQEKIFVDKITEYKGAYNFRSSVDINSRILERKDIIFCINVGFGASPRNIYSYNYKTRKTKKSPHLVNTSSLSSIVNHKDNKFDILIASTATSNNLEKVSIEKSDYSTWITVLNEDLKYKFNPVELKSKGIVTPVVINKDSVSSFFFAFYSKDKKVPSKIIKIDKKGEILNELELGDYSFFVNQTNEKSFFMLNKKTNMVDFYNLELKKQKSRKLPFSGYIVIQEDLNNNGQKEIIIFNNFLKEFGVFTTDFSEYVTKDYKDIFIRDYGFKSINNKKLLYVVQKNKISYYEFKNNSYYYLKYAVYVLIYGLVLLLVFVIIKGQQIRENRKRNIERQILDLQLKNIKNQVDSHFVFNALNTISDISLSGNKMELENFIYAYSKFMRKTLDNSDKIVATIKEEITLVESFLTLQQMRLNYKFDYSITVEKEIDTAFKIPKHCIFTYVENAVKYGLPAKQKGILSISLTQKEKALYICIRDNGQGFSQKRDKSNATKKGFKIIEKIFTLYQSRFRTTIDYTVEEVIKDNQKEGVLVTIKIKL